MDVQDTLMPFIGALEAILRGKCWTGVAVVWGYEAKTSVAQRRRAGAGRGGGRAGRVGRGDGGENEGDRDDTTTMMDLQWN